VRKEGSLGDSNVLKKIYRESFPVVRSYILANSGTEADAKDIFQDSITNAWMNQRQGRFEANSDNSMGAYVFTIAKHKWLDKLRSKTHRSTLRLVKDEVEDKLLDTESIDDIDVDYLNRLYAGLDEKCQILLKKFYFEKMSMREIATDLSVGEESVRTMKYRCVMKLRKMHLDLQKNKGK
jgi:RNA polymerase sigma factor (sigma-70 family)